MTETTSDRLMSSSRGTRFTLIVGTSILLTLSRDAPNELAMLAALIVGFGMGFMMSALIISLQNAVEWRHRGVATASFQFFRTIGGAISVAIMGALLNSNLSGRYDAVPGVPAGRIRRHC